MRVSSVNFKGNDLSLRNSTLSDEKRAWSQLSDTQRAVKSGIEQFRQEYNEIHYPPLKQNKSPYSTFVRMRVSLSRVMDRVLGKLGAK